MNRKKASFFDERGKKNCANFFLKRKLTCNAAFHPSRIRLNYKLALKINDRIILYSLYVYCSGFITVLY